MEDPNRPMAAFEQDLLELVRGHMQDAWAGKKPPTERERKAMEHGAWLGYISTMELLERASR